MGDGEQIYRGLDALPPLNFITDIHCVVPAEIAGPVRARSESRSQGWQAIITSL